MRFVRIRAIFVFAVLTGALLAPVEVFAAGPAGAPATSIGPTVAGVAQTASPNVGLGVAAPLATRGAMDTFTLRSLGLTPPGNAPPPPCLSCTSIVWGD